MLVLMLNESGDAEIKFNVGSLSMILTIMPQLALDNLLHIFIFSMLWKHNSDIE